MGGDRAMRPPAGGGRFGAKALDFEAAAPQSRHLGGVDGLAEEHEASQLEQHSRLTMLDSTPDASPGLGASALARHLRFCMCVAGVAGLRRTWESEATARDAVNRQKRRGEHDMVMSGFSSTWATPKSWCVSSLPPPGGHPCRAGSADPVADARAASFTAQLALTPKWSAASRRELPASTCAKIRCRRSNEYLLPMVHLQPW
jgi:hypothetical protein